MESRIKELEQLILEGKYQQAEKKAFQDYNQCLKDEDYVLAGKALYYYAGSLWHSGNYDSAKKWFQELKKLGEQHNLEEAKADAGNGLGITYHRQGQFEAAISPLEESVRIYKALKKEERALIALNNLGTVFMRLSRTIKAGEAHREVIRYYEEISTRSEKQDYHLALAYTNMALVLQEWGGLEEAEVNIMKALTLQKHKNQQKVKTLRIYASILYLLNNLQEAWAYFQSAKRIADEIGFKCEELLNNAAQTLLDLKKYDEALMFIEEAEEIAKKHQSLPEILECRLRRGKYLQATKKISLNQISKYFNDLFLEVREANILKLELEVVIALARLELEANNLEAAEKYVNLALSRVEESGLVFIVFRCLILKALIAAAMLKFEDGMRNLNLARTIIQKKEIVEIYETTRFKIIEVMLQEAREVTNVYDAVIQSSSKQKIHQKGFFEDVTEYCKLIESQVTFLTRNHQETSKDPLE
ncbi:MAG: tetratricopeptide repeat protein [Candidatus Hodarchaeota archaeon]